MKALEKVTMIGFKFKTNGVPIHAAKTNIAALKHVHTKHAVSKLLKQVHSYNTRFKHHF